MKRIALLSFAALSLGACSTAIGKGTSDTYKMTRLGMREAVTAPLSDFNLLRKKVPAVLEAAAEDPYKLPGDAECPALEDEIRRLDLALGPDADMPRGADRPTIGRRASHAASDAALDAVRDLTTGWIPFRSTVRRLTGASHNQDQAEDATQAGVIRRAYLKGLGLQKGCAYPASPLPAPTKEVLIAQEKPSTVVAEAEPAQVATPEQLPAPLMPTAEPAPPPLVLQPGAPVQQIPPYDPPRRPGV
ncbi:MAG: hypothetical protein KY449_04380 [Proteobacteria bacterium]|nr:hypothetical protein [Pseudomonadota bacterium]